jgi:GAF domain-containing protein
MSADAMHRSLGEQQRRIALMLVESQSLRRVMAALLQKLDLGEVLDIVCTEAQELTGAMGSTVFLLDAERDGWLRVARSTGVAPPNFAQMPIEGSLTGRAVREGTLFLSNDPASEAQAYRSEAEPTALLAVPLRVKGIVIGVLDMVNKPGGFTQQDVR